MNKYQKIDHSIELLKQQIENLEQLKRSMRAEENQYRVSMDETTRAKGMVKQYALIHEESGEVVFYGDIGRIRAVINMKGIQHDVFWDTEEKIIVGTESDIDWGEEFEKCVKNPWYFYKNYCKIRKKDGNFESPTTHLSEEEFNELVK